MCAKCATSFRPNSILINDSTFDDAFTLDSFLYYLSANDGIHTSFVFILCRGRKLVSWSSCLNDNAIWVCWTLRPIVASLLNRTLEEVMKQLCFMVPKIKVVIPFGFSDTIKNFVVSYLLILIIDISFVTFSLSFS